MLEHKPTHRESKEVEGEVLLGNLDFDSDESDIEIEREDQVGVPRHLRLGREVRNLRRSKFRLCCTITALIIFWVLAVIGIGLLRTSGYVRNPFSNGGHYPSMPN